MEALILAQTKVKIQKNQKMTNDITNFINKIFNKKINKNLIKLK